ncbi:DUF1990 domain-containing protein [Blastopirellula sp. JC732]|uniref:DUF1990 domain-containing protein n=1 Tax=Blastopirellula sediminis TaxID=2894196 RepID=A0A9X1MMK9_9BACT|nr:DUF1990 domain-containing protein [Blastopirellula sediminis]MCC9607351.1 DUF1990 domain-containing protein [Blastopirellula sediminis]MCC9629356.1 DUF1990 domain-containing protein [Blastopirellula sediminis]
MPSILKPSDAAIQAFLQAAAASDLTYNAVGATLATPPSGYQVDHTRVLLGRGEAAFVQAIDGLLRWKQFDLGWVAAIPAEFELEVGTPVAIVAWAGGCWWLNACRIVRTIEFKEDTSRFGFAYGTLAAHAESGEERFLVEMDDDGAVWYDILAFSRPHSLLAKAAHPYMRRLQKRFARDSAAAMQKWVNTCGNESGG